MLRRFALLVALSAMGWAGTAAALGLGDIRTRSALNEPFDAEITLLSATPGELRSLNVQLASVATFDRYGLDRPQFLTRLRFEVEGTANGGVVRVTSAEPITEPFVTILVEAVWPQGRLLREYTVLLDPPVFADRGTDTPAPVARPSTQQPRPAAGPAPVQRPRAAPVTPTITGDSYRVQRSDTLWQIAERVQPAADISINQTMLALFEANPQAFAGNINLLNEGALLSIPSADVMRNRGRSAALAEVRRQNEAWRRPSDGERNGTLRLVPPDEASAGTQPGSGAGDGGAGDGGAGDAASDGEAAANRALREELAERDRLLQVKDDEIAELQRRLAAAEAAAAAGPGADDSAAADDAGTASPGVDLGTEDQIFVDDTAEEPVVDTEEADEPEPAPEPVAERPEPRPVAAPPPAESWFDQLKGLLGSTWGMAAIGVVVLLLLLPLVARLRRGGEDDSTGTWEALEDFEDEDDGTREATSRLRAMADDDDSILVVESENKAAKEPAATRSDTFSVEDTFSSETAINLDQSDPIAEADFHMAYGLYDQAADLIKGAAVAEPERRDLKAKLAEIYFVWGNQDGFLDAAQSLHDALGGEQDDDWDKIRIMGQQIAPEHALFAGSAAGAIGAVDLDVAGDGGVSELDVDFAAGDDDGAIDAGSSIDGDADEGLDFAFDATGTDVEPSEDDNILDLDGEDLLSDDDESEAPTVERPFSDSATTQETPTVESEAFAGDDTAEVPAMEGDGLPRADSTAEINLDDLGLDLGNLEATNERAVGFDLDDDELDLDSSIETLGLDDKSMEELAAADEETQLAAAGDDDADADATMLAPASIEDTLVGASDDAETVLSPDALGGGTPANDPVEDEGTLGGTSTGRVPVLTDSDVDLDLEDLTEALNTNDFQSTGARLDDETVERPLTSRHEKDLDEDVFAASMADDGDTGDDSPTGQPQPALDESGSRTMTEVGTKLDLARAYIDMGDPDGARSILKEVAAEGDAAQKQEAQKLLDDLPE